MLRSLNGPGRPLVVERAKFVSTAVRYDSKTNKRILPKIQKIVLWGTSIIIIIINIVFIIIVIIVIIIIIIIVGIIVIIIIIINYTFQHQKIAALLKSYSNQATGNTCKNESGFRVSRPFINSQVMMDYNITNA